jgi:hypothetical protein
MRKRQFRRQRYRIKSLRFLVYLLNDCKLPEGYFKLTNKDKLKCLQSYYKAFLMTSLTPQKTNFQKKHFQEVDNPPKNKL